MTDWLTQWGYLAIVVGTFIEGDAILLASGALAQRHVLWLPWVVLCGCIGSTAWSQLWFQAGRATGFALIARRPRLVARVVRVQRFMHRYAGAYLLGFRFVAGMGTASPAVFGVSDFPARRFFALDAIGAGLWSAALSGAGWGLSAGTDVLFAATHGGT
jgi:membrane protein DedA with SNARE-associated domain